MNYKPVMTERGFEKLIKKWLGLLGVGHPWRVNYVFARPVDEDDSKCYAACDAKPDYKVMNLHFDLTHDGWNVKEKGQVEACIAHEIFHGMLSELTTFTERRCESDPELAKELQALEERVVTWLERMPILADAMED